MIQEIDFIKFNPTQNMTVLVKTNYPVEEYGHVASKIMSYDNVHAEQVGFIENRKTIKLLHIYRWLEVSFVEMLVWHWQLLLRLKKD